MKFKLILVTVLAFGSIAHAQGFLSNLSVGAGFQGVFPGSTFTKSLAEANQPANTQATTKSLGIVIDGRYDFGSHSALDLSLTINRDSEIFYEGEGGALTRVQTNNAEMIASYVVRLPSTEKLKPYALIGGGMVRFSPNGTNYTTGDTTLPSTQMKPAFAYGFGTDFRLSDNFDLRLQYRGLIRSDPDFGLLNNANSPFGTGLKTHVAEPSLQVVYHF